MQLVHSLLRGLLDRTHCSCHPSFFCLSFVSFPGFLFFSSELLRGGTRILLSHSAVSAAAAASLARGSVGTSVREARAHAWAGIGFENRAIKNQLLIPLVTPNSPTRSYQQTHSSSTLRPRRLGPFCRSRAFSIRIRIKRPEISDIHPHTA